ncbi:MAG: O-antigen ligase family protein [Gammaproteobacteria bacterium]|nr:O-antigen ligase family protein [Gammaproteobacteria bacterium]
MFLIYFIALFVAPQLWLEPFVGIRTDFIIYPLWLSVLIIKGKLPDLFKLNSQDYVYILLIVWFSLSMALNTKNSMSHDFLINFIKWFFLYRMVAVSIDSFVKLKSVLNTLLFIISIIAIQAIYHKYYSPDMMGWAGQSLGWVDSSVLRSGGTGRTQWVNIFDGPGVFCVMFTLALPFALRLYETQQGNRLIKLSGMLLVLLIVMAIWTTGSRGGFLATLSVFSFYLMTKMGISLVRITKIGLIAALLFILAPSHLTSIRDENRSAQHRVDMWIEGIEMVQYNPVFGIGKGNYSSYTGRLIAHNSAIEIMGELGVIGLFFWLSLMFVSYKKIINFINFTDDVYHKNIMISLGLALLGYHVSSMFVTLEYETLYFLLGLIRSTDTYSGQKVEYTSNNIMLVGMSTIGFIVLIKLFVSIYY